MPHLKTNQPLADLLRPQTLDEFIGQEHLVSEGQPLYLAIQKRSVPSMIFWGPPGVGKTTLARIIARQTNRRFHALSAVSAGKSDLQKLIAAAGKSQQPAQRDLFTSMEDSAEEQRDEQGFILFLDEIHRFNKAQQDYLLPYVEDGTLTLIGATTENPSFEVISPLLSRLQVFVLHPLTEEEILQIVRRGAAAIGADIEEDAAAFLAGYANGDARAALTLLDNAARFHAADQAPITKKHLKNTLQSRHLRYDKSGEEHYNTISAYIKSMRAGDVDAALYYLARMIDAGEDPRFIARRMVIFASEDIGMALPTALVVANEVFRAVETVGLPEAQINLAHGTVYLASAPKDRSAYEAYFEALEDTRKHGNLPIPMELRNAPTDLMKELGYGQPADEVRASLLPEALKTRRYYKRPTSSEDTDSR